MSEQARERKERYKQVRSEFDDLDTEDKVLFLMEATVSTIARGVDEFGRAVSDEINNAFRRRAEKKEKAGEPGSSPGGTSERSASENGAGPSSESAGSGPEESAGSGPDEKNEETP